MSTDKIAILAADVANKIAAGEVVERPVSVVKELVENAIDAHSTRITVNIKGAGRSLIRVADNGDGMTISDLKLAVQRHATSKIHTVKEIDTINTLGFRGEALPSIASVSNFEMLSCPKGESAAKIKIDGGAKMQVIDAARAPGTTVSIANLFYCVPARAKFLKTNATELSHIGKYMHTIALGVPHVGFKYTVEQSDHFDLPPQPSELPFANALSNRIQQLRGDDFVKECIPIAYSEEGVSVEGYISNWSLSVLNRKEIYFYVNKRAVKSFWLASLIKRAYGTLLSSERYPYAFIYVTVDPRTVDVNIHPGKQEVRFSNQFKIQKVISLAIINALSEYSKAPTVTLDNNMPAVNIGDMSGHSSNTAKVKLPSLGRDYSSGNLSVEQWKKLYGKNDDQPVSDTASVAAFAPAAQPIVSASNLEIQEELIKVVGQASEMYIIAQISGVRNGLVLVDQHAAHERVNYDRVLKSFQGRPAGSQRLLLPEMIEMSSQKASLINAHLDNLNLIGFEIASFGINSFKVDAVPSYIDFGDTQKLLDEVAEDFLALGHSSRIEEQRQRLALLLVCRNSVKFNQSLVLEEMQALIDQLMQTETPWTCPHGRPTMIVLPFDEIEKRFGRRT